MYARAYTEYICSFFLLIHPVWAAFDFLSASSSAALVCFAWCFLLGTFPGMCGSQPRACFIYVGVLSYQCYFVDLRVHGVA